MYPASTAAAVWGMGVLTGTGKDRPAMHGFATALRYALLAAVSTTLLGGCALGGGDQLAQLVSEDQIITGSVVKQAKPEGVAETDAAIIKQTVVGATEVSETKPLAWRNPETGSSGSIVAIDKFMGKHGQLCRGFKTTVSTFAGISFYDGETCKLDNERWVLSWFKPTD